MITPRHAAEVRHPSEAGRSGTGSNAGEMTGETDAFDPVILEAPSPIPGASVNDSAPRSRGRIAVAESPGVVPAGTDAPPIVS